MNPYTIIAKEELINYPLNSIITNHARNKRSQEALKEIVLARIANPD